MQLKLKDELRKLNFELAAEQRNLALKPHFKKHEAPDLKLSTKRKPPWQENLHGRETSIADMQKIDAQAWEENPLWKETSMAKLQDLDARATCKVL